MAGLVLEVTPELDQALRRLLEHGIAAAEVVRVLPPWDVDDPAEVLYLNANGEPRTARMYDLHDKLPQKKPEITPGW